MILPLSETFPELSIEQRLEKAKPKQEIKMSGHGSGISAYTSDVLYWDCTQGVWMPMMKKCEGKIGF